MFLNVNIVKWWLIRIMNVSFQLATQDMTEPGIMSAENTEANGVPNGTGEDEASYRPPDIEAVRSTFRTFEF